MALYHFHADLIRRSAGQSVVAAAAYRAGEKLHCEYYGNDADYTRKGGVICSEILLPSHAPPDYMDRETLWNAVEQAEKSKKAQLAYSYDIALQNELTMEENITLVRKYLVEQFVSKGMIVDCDTRNIVSPRAVVEAYNRLACVLRDTNALVDDLRATLKTALDALATVS